MRLLSKIAVGLIALLALVMIVLLVAAGLMEDRLRAYAEQETNSRITDYTVRIGGLDLHPIRLSCDLADVVVRHKGMPEPPVLRMERARAGVRWSSLLRGRLMADLTLDGPVVQITQSQSGAVKTDVETQAPSPEEQQVWQDTVLNMMRVGLTMAVHNGRVAYFENKGKPVVELTDLQLEAGPLYNVKAERGEYPTPLRLHATLPSGGELDVQGDLDAFAKPHAAGVVTVKLWGMDLKPMAPLADRYHVKLHGGWLAMEGRVQYAPWLKEYELRDLTLEKLVANYVYEPAAPKPEKQAAKKGAEKAKEEAEQPEAVIRILQTTVRDTELGVVHAGVDPPYRVFVAQLSVDLKNFSTRLKDKSAQLVAQGRFMASGALDVRGLFRPDPKAPDFDLSVKVEGTQVKMLNDVLRAHGNIDVAGGDFSVYSQFNVQHGKITGYVKPLIRKLDVYDTAQERGKGVMQKLYDGVVGGATELVENRADEAGTKVDVIGSIKNTEIDTWHAATRLIQNAFLQIIVPRFERPVRPGRAVLNIE